MIKAVCFDFDGTLAHFTRDFGRLMGSVRRDLGLFPQDADDLFAERTKAERGGGAMTFADTVRVSLEKLELSVPDNLEQLAAQTVTDYSAQISLLPGALDVMNFCRDRELPLALITNGPEDMQRAAVRAVGLEEYFQTILISGDPNVGVRKPHPRIFELACGTLGTKPGETLMVGDNLSADVQGALTYGMQAVYLGRPGAGCEALLDIRSAGGSKRSFRP